MWSLQQACGTTGSCDRYPRVTVAHPTKSVDLWDHRVGRHLMDPIMGRFEAWDTRHVGLFTFAHSPKHLELYHRYGFWPRFLTAVMGKRVAGPGGTPPSTYATVPAGIAPNAWRCAGR